MASRQRLWSTPPAAAARARVPVPAPLTDPPTFTPRERQVILLIAKGLTTGQIATKLGISPKTVAAHRHRIHVKLGDGDIATLTRLAIRSGWVSA